jgi:phage anti-repressor protein
MNRKDFKRILKPLIKECIKEVIFEEGVLSTVITEVVKGTQTTNRTQPTLQVEQKEEVSFEDRRELLEEKRKARLEQKRKLLNATGFGGVDIFEGTEPLNESAAPGRAQSPQSLFPGMSAEDAGVDISKIMNLSGRNWKKLAKGK